MTRDEMTINEGIRQCFRPGDVEALKRLGDFVDLVEKESQGGGVRRMLGTMMLVATMKTLRRQVIPRMEKMGL